MVLPHEVQRQRIRRSLRPFGLAVDELSLITSHAPNRVPGSTITVLGFVISPPPLQLIVQSDPHKTAL